MKEGVLATVTAAAALCLSKQVSRGGEIWIYIYKRKSVGLGLDSLDDLNTRPSSHDAVLSESRDEELTTLSYRGPTGWASSLRTVHVYIYVCVCVCIQPLREDIRLCTPPLLAIEDADQPQPSEWVCEC